MKKQALFLAYSRSAFISETGSAFLYILLILTLLSSVILVFLSGTINYINYASYYKYKNKSYYIAKSGVNLATYLISQYGSTPVTYRQLLNKTAVYKGGFPILGGKAKIDIRTQGSKFNINQLIFSDNQVNSQEYAELQRLFDTLGIPQDLLDDIVLFMEKNKELNYAQLELKLSAGEAAENGGGKSGLKSGGYLTGVTPNQNIPVLNAEYKNSFLTIRDLMLVPGMKYKYYYILKHFLTCNSSGLINVNTAPYEVIESLSPLISADAAKELVDFRVSNPLTSVSAVAGVPGFNASMLQSITNLIETSSDFYRIKSEGEYKNGKTTIKSLYYITASPQKIYEIIR